MSLAGKISGMFKRPSQASHSDEPLIPIPIPSLVSVLIAGEKEKGRPLTEQEVISIRDNCGTMIMPFSMKFTLSESRGYVDIAPENVWEEWQEFRSVNQIGIDG